MKGSVTRTKSSLPGKVRGIRGWQDPIERHAGMREGDGSGGGDGGARGELSPVGGSKGRSPSPAPMYYSAPWKGAFFWRVRTPPNNCRSGW